MTGVRGVLFDVDGTLVDSNDQHAHAWVDAFHEVGCDVSFDRVRQMVGMGADKIIPAITGLDRNGTEAKSISERHDTIFMQQYMPHLKSFPGVRPLFERLRGDGLGIFIATSAKPDERNALLQIADVSDLISGAASTTGDEHSKPDPDVINATVRRSGHSASELVMVGDTPYDIEAATRASVRSIAFRCGGWPDIRLEGAAQIYDGPWDMLDHYIDFELTFE